MKGPTILARPSRPPEFKLGQRVATKDWVKSTPSGLGRVVGIEADTKDVYSIVDNAAIVEVIGYRYRVQFRGLGEEAPCISLAEDMLEAPVVEQVIERWRRGEM